MNPHAYSRDGATGVWRRPGFDGLAYSDGEAEELAMLAAVREARDVGTASLELRARIADWPTEYHFSPARHNLLRPFSFDRTDRILELGSGCGAMTRYLGEQGASVLAVEGTLRRAEIAAERCRDLDNVRVACDNLATFDTGERFDVVTLIGVLEYSRRFIEAPDPVLECLRRAGRWLADGGVLILAIENRLGLKYFAGCGEDHLGRPYTGIEDLYGERTAVTFGRGELSALLSAAGLPSQQWYYPFPDYKIPNVVVAERALRMQEFDVPALLFRARSRDYGGRRLRAFDEALARREVWKNGLLGDVANSFLVLASVDGRRSRGPGELASAFNVSRYPKYWTAARFHAAGHSISVQRSYLLPAKREPGRFAHRLVEESYITGPLLAEALHRLARRGWPVEELAKWALPWVTLLKDHALPGALRDLPPHFIDCTPFNCVQGPRGLAYIDAEWSADSPVPLSWVFIRGMLHSLGQCIDPLPSAWTHRELVERVARYVGPAITPADFDLAEKWERAFQAQVRPPADALETLATGERDVFAELEGLRNSRVFRLAQRLRRGVGLLRRLGR